MMKAKHFLLLPVILLFAAPSVKSQSGITDKIAADEYERGPSLDALERAAIKSAEDGDDYGAMMYYRRILETDSLHERALKGYGKSAMNIGAYARAEWAYQMLVAHKMTQPDGMPIALLADAKFRQGKYAGAKELYRYLFIETPVGITQDVLDKAQSGLENCDFALSEQDGSDLQAHLDTLKEINTQYSEFAPFFKGDTLYYSSYQYLWEQDKRYPKRRLTKILYGVPQPGDTLKSELTGFNEEGKHTANIAFNEKGNVMYYTVCQFIEKTAYIHCDIYMRKLGANNIWGTPVKLPPHINLPDYTSTEPNVGRAPGENTEILYFVSDRPGGKGGRDIWYSRVTQDSFSQPVNLAELNTKVNDVTPFYHRNGTGSLYFSSEGWPNVGGYDIFVSHFKGNEWEKPKNMGMPINSPGNDLYFALSGNGKAAVFSSNREGARKFEVDEKHEYEDEQACCYDLFKTHIEKPEMIAVTFNKATGDSLYGTTMQLLEFTPKNVEEEIKVEVPGSKFPFTLQPRRSYLIVASKPRFYPDTLKFDTPPTIWKDTLVKKLYLKPAQPGLIVTVYDKETGEPIPGAAIQFNTIGRVLPNGSLATRKDGTPLATLSDTNEVDNRYEYPLDFDHRYTVMASKAGYTLDTTGIFSTEGLTDPVTIEKKLYLTRGISFAAHTINSATRDTLYGVTYKLVELDGGSRHEEYVNPPGTESYETSVNYDRRYMVIASKSGFTRDTVIFSTKDLQRTDFQKITRELRLRPFTVDAYLPIRLYFDNDEPDKRTTRTTTDREYRPTYVDYYRRKPEFLEKFSQGLEGAAKQAALDSIELFFERDVRGGWEKLFFFSEELYKLMDRGDYIVLTLRGFASPRAATQYNLNLTSRRVASVRNHFLKHDGSIYKKFVDNGQIVIKLEPNGEKLAPKDISDDIKDERRSLYDPRASRERRLEIIGVEVKRGEKI